MGHLHSNKKIIKMRQKRHYKTQKRHYKTTTPLHNMNSRSSLSLTIMTKLKKNTLFIVFGFLLIPKLANGEETETTKASDVENIPKELATGKQIDVTQHKNIQLLPTEQDCGFADKEEPTSKQSGIKLFFAKQNVPLRNPWMVRIVVEDTKGVRTPICAGTLISSRYVLTSATCLTGYTMGRKVSNVILGGHGTACDNGKCIPVSKIMDVSEAIVHPDYVFPTRQHDIGLVKLTKEVTLESFMRPICLPQTETFYANFKNNKTIAIGWPNKFEDGNKLTKPIKDLNRCHKGSLASYMLYPRSLRVTEMTLEYRDYCDRFYKRSHDKFGPERFCASGEINKGICPDDDGGPLQKSVNLAAEVELARTYQIGIVSFHHKLCGQPGIPGGFTNIIHYMPWILDNMSLE